MGMDWAGQERETKERSDARVDHADHAGRAVVAPGAVEERRLAPGDRHLEEGGAGARGRGDVAAEEAAIERGARCVGNALDDGEILGAHGV